MDVFPLMTGFAAQSVYLVVALGLFVLLSVAFAARRRMQGLPDARGNYDPAWKFWGSLLVVAAAGVGMMGAPYWSHDVLSVGVGEGYLELRYPWPLAPIRVDDAQPTAVTVRAICVSGRRSNYARYELRVSLTEGRELRALRGTAGGIEPLARRLAALGNVGVREEAEPGFYERCGR